MMSTENLQSTALPSDAAQIAEVAAAKMDELRAPIADVQTQFTAFKYDPNKRALMPALIQDAIRLDLELKAVSAAYEKTR